VTILPLKKSEHGSANEHPKTGTGEIGENGTGERFLEIPHPERTDYIRIWGQEEREDLHETRPDISENTLLLNQNTLFD
jgi:hypothetical protein